MLTAECTCNMPMSNLVEWSVYWSSANGGDTLDCGAAHVWSAEPWCEDAINIAAYPFNSIDGDNDESLIVENVEVMSDSKPNRWKLQFTVRNIGNREVNGYAIKFLNIEESQTDKPGRNGHGRLVRSAGQFSPVFEVGSSN